MRNLKEKREYSQIQRVLQDFSGNPLRVMLLLITDLVWSFAVLWGCSVLYHTFIGRTGYSGSLFIGCVTVSLLVAVINIFSKCYHGNILNPGAAINRVEEIRRLSLGVIGAYVAGFIILFLSGRVNAELLLPTAVSMGITVAGFPVVRFLARVVMKKSGIAQIRVFVAGGGKTAQMVGNELISSAYYGYRVVGFFDDDISKRSNTIGGAQWVGRLCDAPRLAKKENVHQIICCMPPLVLRQHLRNYAHIFNHVLVIPTNDVLPITAIYPTLIGFVSGFEFQNRVLFRLPRIFKRIIEVLLAIFCIILLLPLFGILAILVKLSGPGPVFYTAQRLGLGGRKIKVFKFRTMYQDADEKLEALLEDNPVMKAEWEEKFKLQHDPRITKIGYFLRRTSLDELPQFINVLRGEMAIVGPRPIVPEEVRYYGQAYDFFTRVRPGITGLWQVSGRSSTDYSKRVMLDMFYVMNWSFWLDWYILWKTALVVLLCRGSC